MIEKQEVEAIMQITTRHILNARQQAVLQEKARLKRALEAEIQDSLDPEWNHGIRKALELVESDAGAFHPVMSSAEINEFTKQVAAKIERLVPRHEPI